MKFHYTHPVTPASSDESQSYSSDDTVRRTPTEESSDDVELS